MDEAAKQVTADLEPALPMTPGQPRREDHHYQRVDVRAVFLFFDPLRGWRRARSRASRTRADWAEEVRQLLEVDYPQAEVVTLVCDNLNTHDIASLYATFEAPTAHHLARRLRLIHTPKHGSWLNMAEMELSVLTRPVPEPAVRVRHRDGPCRPGLGARPQRPSRRRPLAIHHRRRQNQAQKPLPAS